MAKLATEDTEITEESKKAGGVYYTPTFIIDYIVNRTVGKLLESKKPDQVAELKILDPACGSGLFLKGVYQYLLDWHLQWYIANNPESWARKKDPPVLKIPSKLPAWRLTVKEQKRILQNNIYGVDIDPQALEVTKQTLPGLENNIRCFNSLTSDWEAEFPELFLIENPGFDVVLGNPPYGAKIIRTDRLYLARKFKAGTTDTAALMILQAIELTKRGGINGFIVPKPFTYSSNWERVRERFLDELLELVDVGKVWKEVKLEQVIYLLKKGERTERYRTLKRSGKEFIRIGDLPKTACRNFRFYLNGIDNSELTVGQKIAETRQFLCDLTTNTRGAMIQGSINGRAEGRRVIGGKQIQKFNIKSEKGYIDTPFPPNALVKPGSILVQNIVAHIAHPTDHIKIIAAVADEALSKEIVILDTVNQLSNHSNLSSNYLLGLLHSKLINWYVYRFILARAIRTIHFDCPVTDRIPIPTINLSDPNKKICYDRIVALVENESLLQRQLVKAETVEERASTKLQIEAMERQIDRYVFWLYGLTDEEARLVEKTAG